MAPLPVAPATITDEIVSAIAAAGNEDSYVRIVVTRGSGPLSLDPDTASGGRRGDHRVEPVAALPREAYASGIAFMAPMEFSGRSTAPRRRAPR